MIPRDLHLWVIPSPLGVGGICKYGYITPVIVTLCYEREITLGGPDLIMRVH